MNMSKIARANNWAEFGKVNQNFCRKEALEKHTVH